MSDNPTSITVPTASGPVTVPVPDMVPTLDWSGILAIQAASYAAYVQKRNAELVAISDQIARDYNTGMEGGTEPNRPLPQFPKSYIFVPADPNDPESMPSYEQSGPPVVGSIPLDTVNNALNKPPAKDANHIHVGKLNFGAWFTVGEGDGTPAGFTTPPTTSDDGVSGVFQKYTNPFGGWYLKIG